MDEQKLEEILYSIGREEMHPSPELIERVKQKNSTERIRKYWLIAALTMNLLLVWTGLVCLGIAPIHWVWKVMGYQISFLAMNGSMAVLYFYRDALQQWG